MCCATLSSHVDLLGWTAVLYAFKAKEGPILEGKILVSGTVSMAELENLVGSEYVRFSLRPLS